MPRWTVQEHQCISIMKDRLKDQLTASPQYPEVIGERKMIRFLRGHGHDVEKVTTMMSNFLKWRQENKINEIRTNIVECGFDHPLKFPKGETILSLVPQHVILPNAQDNAGSPICVEQYDFVPSEVFKHINIDDYILFVTYSLEYRSLIVEQLSEQREKAFLAGLSPEQLAKLEDPDSPPYGVIVNTCVIRDLGGVGFTHLGAQGQDIIKAVITVASDNYPELMRKCFMINTPFIFNAVWYVIKGLLAARTIAKVSVLGSGFMNELLQDVKFENLPAMVGGGYTGFVKYEPYTFDPDYFVPRSSSSTSSSCDVPSPEIEVSSVAESEPALISSTVSQTATEKADVTTAPGEELSPVVADKFNNAAVEISSNSSGPDTAATGVRARSTAAAAAATTTAAYSNSTAKEGCTGGNKSSKCSTTMASTSITTSTHESEPEDMSFGIISMRTSGY